MINKIIQKTRDNNESINELSQNKKYQKKSDINKTGSCIIKKVTKFGDGCLCSIRIGNSQIENENAICYNSVLDEGTTCQYNINNGVIELIAGTGSSSSTTSTLPEHSHLSVNDGGILAIFKGNF